MIDAIISVVGDSTVQELIDTLNSLSSEDIYVTVVISDQNKNDFISKEISNRFPKNLKIILTRENSNSHMSNFFKGFQKNDNENEIITFLKAGDLFTGIYLYPIIKKEFCDHPEILTMHGNIENMNDLNLYSNKRMNIQGWFFKRDFLNYYSFFNEFKTEIEFALNFSYITELQPHFHKELNKSVVYVKNAYKDNPIDKAFYNYFNNILPRLPFFKPELGLEFLYDLICDCYISYVQAINLEVPKHVLKELIRDITFFYNYFTALELSNLEILLNIYNKKMKDIYNSEGNPYLIKIPDITFIDFLNNFEIKE